MENIGRKKCDHCGGVVDELPLISTCKECGSKDIHIALPVIIIIAIIVVVTTIMR